MQHRLPERYRGLFLAGFVTRGEHNKGLTSGVTTPLVGVLVPSVVVSDVVGTLWVAYDLLAGAHFVPIVGSSSGDARPPRALWSVG